MSSLIALFGKYQRDLVLAIIVIQFAAIGYLWQQNVSLQHEVVTCRKELTVEVRSMYERMLDIKSDVDSIKHKRTRK